MKIVSFRDGLGNQLFQYRLYEYLSQKFPTEKIYGYYKNKWLKAHNGLEIYKYFNVKFAETHWWIKYIVLFLRFFNHVRYSISTDNDFCEDRILFIGYWQDKRKWGNSITQIPFKNFVLNRRNNEILNLIESTNSVSIHIRRGDYLLKGNEIYNICDLEYYRTAMSYIENHISEPFYFVFSDDIEWAKNNIKKRNTIFVIGNEKSNSVLDMFLMSNCKYSIIANSSFSYWGAVNGINKKIVIYPQRWKIKATNDKPNIFKEDWIAL